MIYMLVKRCSTVRSLTTPIFLCVDIGDPKPVAEKNWTKFSNISARPQFHQSSRLIHFGSVMSLFTHSEWLNFTGSLFARAECDSSHGYRTCWFSRSSRLEFIASEQLYPGNVTNRLVHRGITSAKEALLGYNDSRHTHLALHQRHLYAEMKISSHTFYTSTHLQKYHPQFSLSSATKLYNLLKNARF